MQLEHNRPPKFESILTGGEFKFLQTFQKSDSDFDSPLIKSLN